MGVKEFGKAESADIGAEKERETVVTGKESRREWN